jgi:hypothetical protein
MFGDAADKVVIVLAALGADAVLALHLAFILFVVAGGALVVRRPRIAWAHAPALAWAIWIELTHGICPLTPLENRLRAFAQQGTYVGDFIERYLTAIVYPEGLTDAHQSAIAALLVVSNIVLYVWAILHHRAIRFH